MTHVLDPKRLADLGLRPDQLGEPDALSATDDEGMDHGYVPTVCTLAMVAAFLGGQDLDHEPSLLARSAPSAAEAGYTVRAEASNPRLVELTATGQLEVRGASSWLSDPVRSDKVYVELGADPALVFDSTGASLVVYHLDGISYVQPVIGQPVPVTPLASLSSPVGDWLAAEAHDGWLVELLQERAASAEPWSQAVAVGAWGRLRELSAAERAEVVQRLLRGEPHAPATLHLAWARSLSSEQLQSLEELSLAAVDLMHHDLDTLRDEVRPHEPAWQTTLLGLCHQRDDLEGVLALLRESDRHVGVQESAWLLDERARAFLLTVPDLPPLEDPRLARVLARQPEAWWANLGEGGDPHVLV